MIAFGVLLAGVSVAMLRKAWRTRHEQRVAGHIRADAVQPTKPLALLAAATATGLLTGFFGVGGGFAVVPMLVLVLHFSPKTATGTSSLIMIIASAVGLVARIGTGVELDWDIALAFAAASMAGGVVGAKLTTRANDAVLTLAFGILLAGVAAGTLIEATLGAAG